ncbi:RDD family protein [Paenibacillus glycinis]|uniref:RDD family protein n=1 Tax=Paenibacillus glycinis TaxID=2697035 RepID=A0ABW9XZN6_9BACL|nr:RDD family protein [Paenibacillus glycinis]NBD28194.1 RDD family protein [Paenibacillus glycinis]
MKLSLKRLIAYWLDFVILAVVLVGVQLLLYTVTSGFPFDYFDKGFEIESWVVLSMSLPVWAYFISFEKARRQTLGKRLLKLVVVDERKSTLSFVQALGRTFVRLLPWELTHLIILVPDPWWDVEEPSNQALIFIPNLLIVAYIVVLFANKGRRGIHDYVARTKVKEL